MPDTEFELIHISELIHLTEATVRWTVAGIVPQKGVTLLVARGGTGKSLVAYDLAASILTGQPWLGDVAVQKGGVAYIDLDGNADTARQRCLAALAGRGVAPEAAAKAPIFFSGFYSRADIRDPLARQAMLRAMREIPDLRLVVFDTYSDLHGGEEASADDMRDTMLGVVALARHLDCGALVVHHTRKRLAEGGGSVDDVRGSSAIIAKVDAVFFLTKAEAAAGVEDATLTLTQRKARLTREAAPRHLRFEGETDAQGQFIRYRCVPAAPPSAKPWGGTRPSPATVEATKIAVRAIAEHPGIARKELIEQIMAAGIGKSTAYEVTGAMRGESTDQMAFSISNEAAGGVSRTMVEKTAPEPAEDDPLWAQAADILERNPEMKGKTLARMLMDGGAERRAAYHIATCLRPERTETGEGTA